MKLYYPPSFSYIEIACVTFIISILLYTGGPYFLALHSDAKIAALNRAESSIKQANSVVEMKAILEGKEHLESTSVEFGRDTCIHTINGNIEARADNLLKTLDTGMVVDDFWPVFDKDISGVYLYNGPKYIGSDIEHEHECFLFVSNSPGDEITPKGALQFRKNFNGC